MHSDDRSRDLVAQRGTLPIPRRRERLAQLAAADRRRLAREGRRRQLLHVHLHQLAPVAPVRPRVVRGVRDHGLVTIGVHTPEFSFEHDLENIRQALRETRVEYPIAIDNDYAIWEAFANHYWPALYFIDAEGRIRHHRFGEGDYERSESVIQLLLAEAGLDDDEQDYVSVDARGPEAPADWNSLLSPETYLGYRQTMDFASPGGLTRDEPRVYEAPQTLRRNHWSLSGDWTASAEAVTSNEAGGRIAFDVHARDVHLVMGPQTREAPVPFRVTLDGEPPRTAHGSDVDADGAGVLTYPRMVQLIRQDGPIGDRRFEIEFLERGAQAFCFTFG